MTLTRRRFAGAVGAAALGAMPVLRALAQDALDAIPDGPLKEQITWLLGVMNDPDAAVTEEDIAAHFDESFLSAVPSVQMVEIFGTLQGQLRGVTVNNVEVGPSETDAILNVVGSTGLALDITIVVAPASGLITGLLFEPAQVGAEADASPVAAASPVASPVAAVTPPPTTDEILADFQSAVDRLLAAGREATTALLTGDEETFRGMLSEVMVGALGNASLQELTAELTENIVSFSFAEVSAYFAGSYTPEGISGYYHQGTPAAFQMMPDEPQGDFPAGLWTGAIVLGTVRLGIEVTFAGTADDLSATISIPEQGLADHPLSDVRFDAERPLGSLVDERALPMGPSMGTSSYGAVYEWGDKLLAINTAFDADTMVIGMTPVMQVPLPPDPAADVAVATTFQLPFDGAWMVIWGGESEFLNYHSPVPQQRFAHDIVIWRDGATYSGDGTRTEDYHCYGQPQYAPAAGTVVGVMDEYLDDIPGTGTETDVATHPAGNHVVIEVAEDEYVLMAHFQPGSIAVAEGDTVAAGDLVGLTGNSGNSSEPHIHIHMQTGLDMLDPSTVGLPMTFVDILVNGEPVDEASLIQGQIVERNDA